MFKINFKGGTVFGSTKRMMLKADVNRIYDEEVYSEQKIREEKFFVRPTRQRKMKKGKLFSVGMGLDLPFA